MGEALSFINEAQCKRDKISRQEQEVPSQNASSSQLDTKIGIEDVLNCTLNVLELTRQSQSEEVNSEETNEGEEKALEPNVTETDQWEVRQLPNF